MMNIKSLRTVFMLAVSGCFVSGCDEPRTQSASEKAAASKAKAAPKEGSQPREILGKTTSDIRDTNAELGKGGVVANNQESARKTVFAPSKQYISAIDRVAAMHIQHAVELYRAETGEYPKDYDEFMSNVIKKGKPDEIRLPQLPHYQEYSYDAQARQLIVIEYPDRKSPKN